MARAQVSHKVQHGQYYTSSEVTRFMVALASVPKDARVLEPGYGEGAFLASVLEAGYTNVTGYDIDPANQRAVKKRFGTQIDARLESFLEAEPAKPFQLIIGNPPYVQWNNITEETRALLSTDDFWKPYANGEWDLLYAFILWSVEHLTDDGELIFIVPYNWFSSTHAATLRDYLGAHGSFETLVHFSEYKLFADCAPNALILKYRKGERRYHFVKVAEFEGRKGQTADLVEHARKGLSTLPHDKHFGSQIGDWRFFTNAHLEGGAPWYLAAPSEERAVRELEGSSGVGVLSGSCEISVGVVSGYDRAFLISQDELGQLPAKERKLVEEMVKAQGCARYEEARTSPYIFTEDIADEGELRRKYPKIYEHLLAHKEGLEARYSQGRSWWQWATIRNLETFRRNANKPKLFVPGIDRSLKSRFCLSTAPTMAAGDVICVTARPELREDMLYVLGWLNSATVNTWYRIKGPRNGHRTRYPQSHVSSIPYRQIDFSDKREKKLHDRVVSLVKDLQAHPDDQKRQDLEDAVDQTIHELLSS